MSVDAFAIGEDFEVVGSDGDPIGLVDGVEEQGVKLKKDDAESGGKHHYIPLDIVTKVEVQNRRVHLNLTGDEAQALWEEGD